MRTLIDLPPEQIEVLAAYCREERISRAEAVRRAVSQFLPTTAKPKRSLSQHPAFGSWKKRKIDALEYQRRLRSEWKS